MKKLTVTEMLKNIALATDSDIDFMWFSDKADYYMTNPNYSPEIARKFTEIAYESIMVRIALETIPDKTERAIFYIENGLVYETAKTIEEVMLPLLDLAKRGE